MRSIFAWACIATTLLLLGSGALAATPSIRNDTLTISGISAGAAFAVQYQVAHSATVHAAGIIAGLPWYCATFEGMVGAYSCMDDPYGIDIANLNSVMNLAAQDGTIDAVSNIKNHAVMLFSGVFDTVVAHGSMELLATQYQGLGVTNLVTYFNYSAEHAWITNYAGNSCSTLGSPYINNCGLDFAGEFLRQAFKQLGLPFNENRGTFDSSNLMQFSQTSFGADGFTNSLDSVGYYYVPKACQPGSANKNITCHVHVNFHGCTQGQSTLGTIYVSYTGLNEWAEANNIIIVYPQAAANDLLENPNGCFDWWGYAGSNYANKQGAQMQFTSAVIAALTTSGSLPSV